MKLSQQYFYTLREDAKDEESKSSNLLVRAGMIKKSSSGVYMLLPLGYRVLSKITKIIEEEMDATGAQQVLMPALINEEVYIESGRRAGFGSSMFALKDRFDKNYVLAPTHEELFVYAGMMNGKSYKSFPFNLYQIQTKFRDEPRPRYGLIRVREFIMKDAYSFDIDLAGLDNSYKKMFDAYVRIFDRMKLNYRIVKADTGVMGGLLSEEFQAISDIGEDILVVNDESGFSSNLEIAPVVLKPSSVEEHRTKEKVHTPNAKTINEVASFLNQDVSKFVKTLLYKVDGKLYAFLLKGNRELNEAKVLKLLNASEIEIATPQDLAEVNTVLGFVGPIGLNIPVVADQEVLQMHNFICGANEMDYHFINANIEEFAYVASGDIGLVNEFDVDPISHKPLTFVKGIEIGNTFKLGSKYAKALGMLYTDANNKLVPVEMGSYGIGLGRCMAAIAEQNNDDFGLIWPKAVAPYQVAIVVVDIKDELQMQVANDLYAKLQKQGIDCILDDRKERVGVKFKDMELIGIPLRIVVGKKISEDILEFKPRTQAMQEIKLADVQKEIENFINEN